MSGLVSLRPARCLACTSHKHTQCERVFDATAECVCRCQGEDGITAFWAMEETARYWPHVMAARAMIASSLRICYSKAVRSPGP